jgi:pimeloyl-ACP methyl ester carboxylesterase
MNLTNLIRWTLPLFYLTLALPLSLFAAWFLFRAQTWTGVGLSVLTLLGILLPVPLTFWLSQPTQNRSWGWISLLLTLIEAGLLSLLLWRTPSGVPAPGSPVQHRFVQPVSFPRYTIANIVPEIEQINLGFVVTPYLDRLFTAELAQRVAPFTLALYRDMENDPNFHQLGSVMGWAYADVLHMPFEVGHYYLYIPKNRPAGPLPAIIFLHGNFGNFKTYTWVWSKLAEREGLVILAPSYGFGNWRSADSASLISQVLADAATQVELDPRRLYLAGLSNGGLSVSRLASAQPERFRGLIFLSPVMDTPLVDSSAFQQAWQGRPVLVITGAADERIPLRYVQQRAATFKAGGITVTERVYPGETHFLFFSQPEAVLSDISTWLAATAQ